jgi:hypothetical protein
MGESVCKVSIHCTQCCALSWWNSRFIAMKSSKYGITSGCFPLCAVFIVLPALVLWSVKPAVDGFSREI